MSFIQSTYGTPNAPGNFEVVLLQGNNLVHYYRDNSSAGGEKWHGPTATISSKATAPGCIIQSSYSTPDAPGNFEVVVLEGNNLVHYYRDNSSAGGEKWHGPTAAISSKATGPGTIIQTSYSTPNAPGNLEVIVPEGKNWVHYYRDDSASGGQEWYLGAVIAST
jgi:hypothetical protein